MLNVSTPIPSLVAIYSTKRLRIQPVHGRSLSAALPRLVEAYCPSVLEFTRGVLACGPDVCLSIRWFRYLSPMHFALYLLGDTCSLFNARLFLCLDVGRLRCYSAIDALWLLQVQGACPSPTIPAFTLDPTLVAVLASTTRNWAMLPPSADEPRDLTPS